MDVLIQQGLNITQENKPRDCENYMTKTNNVKNQLHLQKKQILFSVPQMYFYV